MTVFGPPEKVEFFTLFVAALQAAVPGFTGPATEPLPFQLKDPKRLQDELTAAGLRNVHVETIVEQLVLHSGDQLWDWLTNSNPIVGMVLHELAVTNEQTTMIRATLNDLIHERAGSDGRAVLTNPINIGVGTK